MALLGVILGLGIFFGFLFFFIKSLEQKSVFFQVKGIQVAPDYFQLPFEDIFLKTTDKVKINGWFIPNSDSQEVLLFFHGNGGNISHRLHKISCLHQLGVSIFLIDYRGYGNSSGRASVPGIYKDASAALDFLLKEKKYKPGQIFLYGESLGSAPAIDLASLDSLAGLILDGAFSCGQDMAKLIFPYLPRIFIPNILNNLKAIGRVKLPKLFLHSRTDEIVPFSLSQSLYRQAANPKEFVELIGGHNTSYIDSQDKYLQAIGNFFSQVKNKEKLGSYE